MARRPRNHYDALGIPRNAKAEEIRKAYRRKAKEHHPDANGGGDALAFRAAQEAYEALRDPSKREAYDAELRRAERVREAPHGGSRPFSSPFDRPFDSTTGRPSGGRPSGSGAAGGGMEGLFGEEDELFNRILHELFGGGPADGGARPGGGFSGNSRATGSTGERGRSAFGGFGDMFSDPGESGSYAGTRRGHRHLRDEEPLSVVVHLSPDESYTGGTVSVDIGAGRSILASIPPGARHGDVIRSEFMDSEGPRELKLHIRID